MKSTLFITGASGFIGRSLLQRLDPGSFEAVLCLTRNSSGALLSGAGSNVRTVVADLCDVHIYKSALASADTVVHLAATTGNAPAGEHFRVNAQGTAQLLQCCEAVGVKRFLFVSSIAARFADTRNYPYAQAKKQAEAAVRQSRLRYTIVRPTIVLGPGSPIGARLQSLAVAPVTPVFGNGKVQLQPIYVDDLTDCLLAVVATNRFENETLELGGPESLTMNALLERMRNVQTPKRARLLHVPVEPLRTGLGLLDRLPVRLPVSAGQIASFINDGTATPNDLTRERYARMKTVNEMIALSMKSTSAASRHRQDMSVSGSVNG